MCSTEIILRIDWADMDLFGHVNNVAFFRYIQAGRVNFWEKTGIYRSFLESKQGPILASAGCQFKKALHYPGEVTVFTKVDEVRESSFGLIHELKDREGNLCAIAHDVIVMYNFTAHHKISIPDNFRKILTSS